MSRGRLLLLPPGTTATRGAHRMLSVLAAHDQLPDMMPGKYRCVPVGWSFNSYRDSGCWSWWMQGPDGMEICGSAHSTRELWSAHKSHGCIVGYSHGSGVQIDPDYTARTRHVAAVRGSKPGA